MFDQEPQALSGPDFLTAVADAERANGKMINGAEYSRRAKQWRDLELKLESTQAELMLANDRLSRVRAEVRAA